MSVIDCEGGVGFFIQGPNSSVFDARAVPSLVLLFREWSYMLPRLSIAYMRLTLHANHVMIERDSAIVIR